MKVLKMVGCNAVTLDLPANLNVHSTVSVAFIKSLFRMQNQPVPPVQIGGFDEFELESISDHFIEPDRSLSASKVFLKILGMPPKTSRMLRKVCVST